jgi:hypothetical protein
MITTIKLNHPTYDSSREDERIFLLHTLDLGYNIRKFKNYKGIPAFIISDDYEGTYIEQLDNIIGWVEIDDDFIEKNTILLKSFETIPTFDEELKKIYDLFDLSDIVVYDELKDYLARVRNLYDEATETKDLFIKRVKDKLKNFIVLNIYEYNESIDVTNILHYISEALDCMHLDSNNRYFFEKSKCLLVDTTKIKWEKYLIA